ncbi:MAG: gluconeogenesis factor YvcK family protein [Anaerolineales bacterium]
MRKLSRPSHRGWPPQWRGIQAWLIPGIGIKRWLVALVLGTLIVGLGLAAFILDAFRGVPNSLFLSLLTLRFLSHPARVALLLLAGGAIMAFSLWHLTQGVLAPFRKEGRPVGEVVADHHRLGKGPQITAIGGGTGLSTLLRGMKSRTSNITAVVTVADDGGSSGRLRRSLGIPPPGDLRNCLAALSDDESLLTRLFQYRFAEGDGLNGHSFGNLFVSALAGVTGNFEEGLSEAGNVLAIRGRVLPSTLREVRLIGELEGEGGRSLRRVEGETQIQQVAGAVRRVSIEPEDVPAYPVAVQAILNSDMVVVGPGSLFTSILPNLLIGEISAALRATPGLRVYVCNIATQPGETDGFSAKDHLDALELHMGFQPFDVVLVNVNWKAALPEGVSWVREPFPDHVRRIYRADLGDEALPGHHDPQKLAAVLASLLQPRRTTMRP